jgi:hypothetical protein
MGKKKFNIRTILFVLISAMMIMNACKKEEIYPRTRLFSPVLNAELLSVDNTIIVNMGKMKEAVSYTLELSRDTFKTKDYTVEIDTNYVIINKDLVGEDLLWFTMYQVRATAHADDPKYDSKVSDLGNVRTQKFPSNMGTPTSFDILDTQAKVFWTTAGDPVTNIKVFALTDVRLSTPLLSFTVTPAQQVASQAIIYGLSPSSKYYIAIYSGSVIRGWEAYITKPPLVSGSNVINLAGIAKSTILADTLPDIASGSIVLLEGGRTYATGGYKFNKSITFMSGYSFVPALPLIDCSTNFGVLGGSTVDSIVFKEIALSGTASSYVFNPSEATAVTVGLIKFESCRISTLRGIIRFRGPAPGTVAKYSITNCRVDNILDYGLFTMDTSGGITMGDILLKNSTFSKCQAWMATYTTSKSLTIESCTISEAPATGGIMFRWRGVAGSCDITNGLTIRNTIWGHAWDKASSGGYAVNADNGNGGTTPSLDATTIIVINTYSTSQFAFTTGRELAGFPVGNYANTDVNLWVDPVTNLDFHFKDTGFAGKSDSGDPRWRPL